MLRPGGSAGRRLSGTLAPGISWSWASDLKIAKRDPAARIGPTGANIDPAVVAFFNMGIRGDGDVVVSQEPKLA